MEPIIQLTVTQIFGGIMLFILGLGIIQWILSIWIKSRLEQSIRHEYDRQLEEYKFSLSKRDKVANIASFFSLWIKYRGNERAWLDEKELIEYYRELTKMSFELALWVDDENLLKDVMKRLKNKDGSQGTIELLLKVKKLISENKESSLKAEDITLWPADTKFIERK
ncbi:MAG: hypothetical protein ACYCY6_00100 [Minisyncoccota bacterium]